MMRCLDAYRYCCVLSVSNFFFQALSLLSPLSDAQTTINISYMAGTLVCCSLLILANKKKRFMKQITYGVSVYLIFRNSFRLLDFEETKDKYESLDRWHFFVMI